MPYINSIERLARKEGRAEGRAEECVNIIRRAVHSAWEDGFSEAIIARFMRMDEVTVRKILKNESFEIPGHFLLQDAEQSKPSEVSA